MTIPPRTGHDCCAWHGWFRLDGTGRPSDADLVVMCRLGMVFDHEAEIEDMGMVFQAVVYAMTSEQWRSGAGGVIVRGGCGGA